MNKVIKVVAVIAALGALVACDPPKSGKGSGNKATEASYASDGATQFGDPNGKDTFANEGATGKLKWGVTYRARYIDTTDRTNCSWKLYTISAGGVVTIIKKGNYLNAKINVGEQVTKRVFLKSEECGNWKP